MKKLAILLFGAIGLSTTAQAVDYDFVAEGIRIQALENVAQGYSTYITGVTEVDGVANPMPLGLTISAHSAKDGDNDFFVYMDGLNGDGEPGGMGICGIGDPGEIRPISGSCNPSDDDNQTAGEYMHIVATDEAIKGLTITGNHMPVAHGGVDDPESVFLDYWADGGLMQSIEISGAYLDFFALSSAANDLWYTIRDTFENDDEEMYVTMISTVPVPAAVWLFGSAMLGLFGLRRKSKMEALAA